MALSNFTQLPFNGDLRKHTVREALVATTSYVASNHFLVGGASAVGFVVTYASVDYTSLTVAVQATYDPALAAASWFQVRNDSTSINTTYTLANFTSASSDAFWVWAYVPNGVYAARMSILRTGGTATGTVAIDGYVEART